MTDTENRAQQAATLENLTPVTAYITEARAIGLSHAEITSELMLAGWAPEAIKLAFMGALRVPYPQGGGAAHSIVQKQEEPIINVRNLTKKYGTFTAVDDISFSVNPGETFGILGPNGAGKTTTLEMIEGIKRITSGTITVDGKDVATQTHAVKSVIGVQLQASSFFEELNLAELIEVFAATYQLKVDPLELLDMVQLLDKAKSKIGELSGGQKQRFSIAVGLVNEPKVLFLDEPTTGLDPQARHNLWDLVRQIKARGTTIVLTTHYMEEAEVLCDRIAIMDHAKVVALDTTRNLLRNVGIDATITFKSDNTISSDILQNIIGVQSVVPDTDTYTLTTTQPRQTLDGLFAVARQHGFSIEELAMKEANLEDVFLQLTGHQLRD